MIESNAAGWERQNGYDARNLTTHWTGARVSKPVIVELAIAVLNARPVNSGVRRFMLCEVNYEIVNLYLFAIPCKFRVSESILGYH
jgi:hypothetical protein